jgi:hypothetical protein
VVLVSLGDLLSLFNLIINLARLVIKALTKRKAATFLPRPQRPYTQSGHAHYTVLAQRKEHDMNERQELLEALDDNSGALDDMRGTESVLGDYLKRHKEDDSSYDNGDGKGRRYRIIESVYHCVTDAMGYEDEVSSIFDDLSEEEGEL